MYLIPGLIRTVGIKYIQKHHVLIYWLQNDMYLDLLYTRSLAEAFHFLGFCFQVQKNETVLVVKTESSIFI